MVANDASSIIKADLEAGSYTNYTKKFPIYIENKDIFQGGNVYILLRNATRIPTQTYTGSIIFTKGGCTIAIVADTDIARDNLYEDVLAILIATSRGYEFDFEIDIPYNKESNELTIDVSLFI